VASIVVFVEVRAGAVTRASRFAVAEARRVATELGATVFALVATGPSDEAALEGYGRTLGEVGADRVLCYADARLAPEGPLLDDVAGPILAAVGERLRPLLTLFPAGSVAAALAPPLSLRLRGVYQPRAALALTREPGRARLFVRRLRATDGAVLKMEVGEAGHPVVVATLAAGDDPPRRGLSPAEVEALAPAAAGERRVRLLASEPDEGERVELAAALVAVGPGLNAAERTALRAAAPPDTAVVEDDGGGAPGLETACPARLLVMGRGPAPVPVRATLAPDSRVAVAGTKAAEKDLPHIDLLWRPAARQRLAGLTTALRGDAEKAPS
jgi:electron transfer flavoprotein alpha subunit